ncbi:endonuclease/exonuclease/phosphatase family protein [Klosneuvirus KNV1]|uniref:Endonuclease/exonuclease/phosphatase family protein n=1 Tax=Klosneuvirus KNV1 TaxID=1977640 RepID=A0A1V0SHV2_9VIRU|nr:endonuclease/exonuclease/phosphatase family protein [Klosneuvirus KNV1]
MSINVAKNLGSKSKDILIKFYADHPDNYLDYLREESNSLIICSYNVHGWVNINAKINVADNFANILKLFQDYDDIDILVLQEVCFRDYLTENYIKEEFQKIGFNDSFSVPNGGCFLNSMKTDYIMILSKEKFQMKKEIDVTIARWKRSCLIVKYKSINILAVHLEIGKSYHHLPINEYRKKIESDNTKDRIIQLNKLLNNDIDMIVGDFNFTPNDPEFKWLLDKEFIFCQDLTHTTPFNRTDMVFIKDKISNINNKSISCNYSDHLPIISEIKIL